MLEEERRVLLSSSIRACSDIEYNQLILYNSYAPRPLSAGVQHSSLPVLGSALRLSSTGRQTSGVVKSERGRISKIRAHGDMRNEQSFLIISGSEGRGRSMRPASGPSKTVSSHPVAPRTLKSDITSHTTAQCRGLPT